MKNIELINDSHLIVMISGETNGLCRESRVQCAAVNTYFEPMSDPPHQNSTRLSP